MAKKSILEKIETKINKIIENDAFKLNGNKLKYRNKLIFEYSESEIKYNKWRYRATNIEPIYESSFLVTIILDDKKYKILESDIVNPPITCSRIVSSFKILADTIITNLVIGAPKDILGKGKLEVTQDTYEIMKNILSEEKKELDLRVKSRFSPLISTLYNVETLDVDGGIDYGHILKEMALSGNISEDDIAFISMKLNSGSRNSIVIENQVKRQTEWLIDSIQKIIDEPSLSKTISRKLGNELFSYDKNSIKGPEHLMEKILTDFGKNTLFGSPYLINTNKYVLNSKASTRSQFDILLINQFNDVEIVELKKPDAIILDYDAGRNKFYASKDLSIAISQVERYLTAILHDNDEEYLINKKKVRDFLNDEVSGTINVDILRPTGIIIVGSYQTICKPCDNELSDKKKEEYYANSFRAYRELKKALKNIEILTYSELIENARLRLI